MSKQPPETPPESNEGAREDAGDAPLPGDEAPKEIGGRQGPDPTRYGDWEKGGRCIDF
ncbi:DUF1674 domain-containing protein [Lentisalinibacter salinarum]|uniref:DUF1674 domain-containing protein n=1 Tax=Lentisalinibacter salinarum TaxID=2992239 RepID=UPI00386A0B42